MSTAAAVYLQTASQVLDFLEPHRNRIRDILFVKNPVTELDIIELRQSINAINGIGPDYLEGALDKLKELLDELNVKAVRLHTAKEPRLAVSAKLNKKTAAAKLGPKLKEAEAALAKMTAKQLDANPLVVAGVELAPGDIVREDDILAAVMTDKAAVEVPSAVSGKVLELGGALEKNNTGVDLRQLFIGTEGTLGIVTEATLKLTREPGHLDVFFFAVEDLAAVLRVFEAARKGPFEVSAFEMLTDRCLARLHRHRGLSSPLETDASHYVLLEVESHDRAALDAWLEGVIEQELVLDGTLAAGLEQARKLWELREGISESLSATGLPHKNDIALPIDALPAFCAELERAFEERYPDFEVCLFGHIGDGNLHVNVMKPDEMDKAAFLSRVSEADAALFELVRAHRGSISAEHGIGLLKKKWLGYTRSEAEIALMRQMKQVLDPKGILNPGKVFG